MLQKKNIPHYLALIRINKPIGIYLLLWPTLWALWIASRGTPNISVLLIFTVGVFIMRSAGCIINDIADRNFDPFVERTKTRPLAAQKITLSEAITLLIILLSIAFFLALLLSFKTLLLSLPALIITLSYPYMKRFHSLPQAHLGIAFSFGIPMVFMEIQGTIPLEAYMLILANIFWVLCFDTEYAMSDREDDKKINVRSSALLFESWLGNKDYYIIILFQTLVLTFLAIIGHTLNLSFSWWLALFIGALMFIYHIYLIRAHDRALCFYAFLHNNWFGLVIFLGLIWAF